MIKFDYIISSDLGRAYKTAEILKNENNFKNNLKILKSDLAREIDAGVFQGKKMSEYRQYFIKSAKNEEYFKIRAEGGECLEDMYNRMKILIKKILDFSLRKKKDIEEFRGVDSLTENRVLLVSHGGWISQLRNYVDEESGGELKVGKSVQNCSLTILEAKERNSDSRVDLNFSLFGDVSHLEDNQEDDSEFHA